MMNIVIFIILISGISLLLLCLFVLLFCLLCSYIFGRTDDNGVVLNKIKFQSFLSFYAINPKRWTLLDGNVIYTRCDETEYRREYKKYIFRFSFIDHIKYFFGIGLRNTKNQILILNHGKKKNR